MVKGFMFNVNWQPSFPVKLAANECGIDRTGLINWLKTEFPCVIAENGLPQTKISYGRNCVAVFGQAEELLLLKVKEVLEYACKYNEWLSMQWQQES